MHIDIPQMDLVEQKHMRDKGKLKKKAPHPMELKERILKNYLIIFKCLTNVSVVQLFQYSTSQVFNFFIAPLTTLSSTH